MKGKIAAYIVVFLIIFIPCGYLNANLSKLTATSVREISLSLFPNLYTAKNKIGIVFDYQIKSTLRPALIALSYAPVTLLEAEKQNPIGLFSREMSVANISTHANALGIDFSQGYLPQLITGDETEKLLISEMDALLKSIIEKHSEDDFNPVDIYLLGISRWITVYSTFLTRQGLANAKTSETDNIAYLLAAVDVLSKLTSRSKGYQTLTKDQILLFTRKVNAALNTQTQTGANISEGQAGEVTEVTDEEALLLITGNADLYVSFKDSLDALLLNFAYNFLSLREPQREKISAVSMNFLDKLSNIYKKFALMSKDRIKDELNLTAIAQAEDMLAHSSAFMNLFLLPSRKIASQGGRKF